MQRFLLFAAILIAATHYVSCKKSGSSSSSSSSPGTTTYGFLPTQGVYTYAIAGSDGTAATETVTVSAPTDTAGGHAVALTTVVDGSSPNTTPVFANGTATIFGILPSSQFDSLAEALRATPGITGFTYSGWPVDQTFTNTGRTGDALNFTGGPINMQWSGTDGMDTISGEYNLSFRDGSAIASGVQVVTPAGTFTCSEWVYSKEWTFQSGPIDNVIDYADTIWMAPGRPFIKSTESGSGTYTAVLLNKAD